VKITTTLINEMERRGERYGIVAICEGGGTSNATIFELCRDTSKL
jgi:acetyl-CoA acetyltransferase